jgi:hypothetical protein
MIVRGERYINSVPCSLNEILLAILMQQENRN